MSREDGGTVPDRQLVGEIGLALENGLLDELAIGDRPAVLAEHHRVGLPLAPVGDT